MSELRDKVENYLADAIQEYADCQDEMNYKMNLVGLIAEILSYPNIAIVDRKAKLPLILVDPALSCAENVRQCKAQILKRGWVKEVKN